jgi:activator of HSP90 ATPase
VFELYMDAKKHAAFTSSPAQITRKVGDRFRLYDDYITGKNLEIIKDKRIVQLWKASDWPAGHYSKVSFELEPVGKKTRLVFVQSDIPEGFYTEIKQGWIDFYWKPMKDYLKQTA